MGAETEPALQGGFTPRQVRMLKASVIIMGVLIVVCLFALMAGLYYQANKPGKRAGEKRPASLSEIGAPSGAGASGRGEPVALRVKAGSVMESLTAEGGLLILRLKTPDGGEIAILDAKSGEEIRRIVLKPE